MSDAKKRKTDGSAQKEKKAPPLYGDRLYWEERYKKQHLLAETGGNKKDETTTPADGEIMGDNDALPYHEWYFTYEELRPLILPLILGGREEAFEAIASSNLEGNVGGKNDENPDQPQLSREVGNGETSEKSTQVDKDEPEPETNVVTDTAPAEIKDDSDSNDGGEQAGLARAGPISVLEVGCGDVPLGSDLALELLELERVTGESANNVVHKIVCCDYSESVIDTMRQAQASASEKTSSAPELRTTNSVARDPSLVEYVVADARKLTYPDASFHLVLEKGTLDAMLSDTEIGVSSCVMIVTECARVVAVGGYILLVSHLNAHTNNGLQWLDEVVVPGLRAGGGDATWEIEVHGSDDTDELILDSSEEIEAVEDNKPDTGVEAIAEGGDDTGEKQTSSADEDGEDAEDKCRPPSGSPGPAVYIIHKMPGQQKSDNDAPPTVPLKFFAY